MYTTTLPRESTGASLRVNRVDSTMAICHLFCSHGNLLAKATETVSRHKLAKHPLPPPQRNLVVEELIKNFFLLFLFWCYFLVIIFINGLLVKEIPVSEAVIKDLTYFQLFWHCKRVFYQ